MNIKIFINKLQIKNMEEHPSETHLIEQAPSHMSGMEGDEYDQSMYEQANET